MNRNFIGLAIFVVGFVGCGSVDGVTSATIMIDSGTPTIAKTSKLLVIRDAGVSVIAVSATIGQDNLIGFGIPTGTEEKTFSGDAFVFFQKGGQRLEGVCPVTLSQSAEHLMVSLGDCTIGAGKDAHRITISVVHDGQKTEVGVADSVALLPGFAVYGKQVETLRAQPLPVRTGGNMSGSLHTADCSCQPSCDSYLTGCLLLSFTCGPYYAVCAGSCYYQHGDCLRGCGC